MALKAQAQFTNPYEQAYVTYHSSPFFNEDAWRKIASGADASNLNMYIDALSKSKSLDYKKFTKDYNILPGDVDSNITALYNEVYGSRIANNDRYQVEVYKYDENGNMLYDVNGNAKTELKTVSEYEYNKMVINQNTNNKLREQLQRIKYEARDPGVWATAGAITIDVAEGMVEFFNKFGSLLYTLGEMAFTDKTFAEDWFSSWDANYKPVLDRIVVDGVSASQAVMDFENQYTYMRDADGNYTTFGRIANGVATTTGEMVSSFITGGILSAPITGASKAASIVTSAIHTATYYTPLAFYGMGEQYKQITANGQSVSTAAMFANQAVKTGLEITLEIGLGKLFGSTGLDKWLFGRADAGKIAKKIGKPSLLRGAGKLTSEAAQEGLEEFLQEFSGYFVDTAFSVMDDNFSQEFEWQNFIDAAIIGAITSGMHSAAGVAFTPTTKITGPDGKVTKLGKFASYYYNANIGSLVETLRKAQIDMAALFTSMPKNAKLKSLEKQRSELQSQVDEIDERLASHDQSTLQMEQALVGGLGEGYSLNENLELIENYAKSQETDNRHKNELVARIKSLDDSIEQVKSLADNSTETEEHWIEEAQKNNYVANMDKLYIAARAVQSFANLIGDERLAKAEQILTDIKTAAEEGRFNEVEATKSSAEMIKELQLRGIVVTKGLAKKLLRAGITKIKHVFKKDDEETADINESYREFAENVFKYSNSLKNIVVTEDGNSVVSDEHSLFVPDKNVKFGVKQVLNEDAEHRVVQAVLDYDFKGDTISEIVDIYRDLIDENGTEYDAVRQVLFDPAFFMSVLTGQTPDAGKKYNIADLNMYQFLSSLYDIAKSLVPKDVRDAVYRKRMNEIREAMSDSLMLYCIINPFSDYNLSIFSKSQLAEIRKYRESYEVGNRLANVTASTEDWNFIFAKLNALTIDSQTKANIKEALESKAPARIRQALIEIDQLYNTAFYGAFDGKTYMPLNSLKNRTFNHFLYTYGLTLNDISDILRMDQKIQSYITDKYKSYDQYGAVSYYSDLLKKFTDGQYKLEMIKGDNPDFASGEFLTKAGGSSIRIIDTYETNPDFEHGELESNLQRAKNKTIARRSNRHNKIVNDLLNSKAIKKGKNYYTIDDVIANPNLLKKTVLDQIRKDMGSVSNTATYRYIKRHLKNSGSNLTISMAADGSIVFVDLTPMDQVFAKDISLNKVNKVIKGEIKFSELLSDIHKSIFADDIKIKITDNDNDAGYFTAEEDSHGRLTGVIYINRRYLKDLKEIKRILSHEFQHVIQSFTMMNSGTDDSLLVQTNNKAQAKLIVQDIEKHVPNFFDENLTEAEKIKQASEFIYYSSGEIDAYGAVADVPYYPVYIKTLESKKLQVTMPWGTTYELNISKKSKILDKEYMKAVKENDTEKLDKMIKDAAVAGGFDSPMLYHGTGQFGFVKPDVSKSDDGLTFFTTDSISIAHSYADEYSGDEKVKSIHEAHSEEYWFNKLTNNVSKFLDLFKELYPSYDTDKIMNDVIDNYYHDLNEYDYLTALISFNDAISKLFNIEWESYVEYDSDLDAEVERTRLKEVTTKFGEVLDDESLAKFNALREELNNLVRSAQTSNVGIYGLYADINNSFVFDANGSEWDALAYESKFFTTRDLAKNIFSKGYDVLVIKNVYDSADVAGGTSTLYVFRDPARQLRSADRVVYDEDGEIIPLSERFGHKREDFLGDAIFDVDDDSGFYEFNEKVESFIVEGKKEVSEVKDAFYTMCDVDEIIDLADKVFQGVDDVEVKFISQSEIIKIAGRNAAGIYRDGKIYYNSTFINKLYQAGEIEQIAEILLHEFIHARVSNTINEVEALMKGKKFSEIKDQLTDAQLGALSLIQLYRGLKTKQIASNTKIDVYGMSSVQEFVAEFANYDFRQYLKEQTLWEKIINAIKMILGINKNTVYEIGVEALNRVLEAGVTLNKGDTGEIYLKEIKNDEVVRIDHSKHQRSKGRTARKRVAKKYAIGTPLEPFVGKRVSLPLQEFIMKSGEQEYRGIDKSIRSKIRDGSLKTADLMNYLKEVDANADTAEITFKLINETIFHNNFITSLKELDEYILVRTDKYYAMRAFFREAGMMERLMDTGDPGLYDTFMSMLENNPAIKSKVYKIAERYWSGPVINEKNLRRLWMQHFDGSVDSAGYIAAVARVAAFQNWKVSGEGSASLSLSSSVGRGKDKASTLTVENVVPDAADFEDFNRFINSDRIGKLISAMDRELVLDLVRRKQSGENLTLDDVGRLRQELSEEIYALSESDPEQFAKLYAEKVQDDEELANALYLQSLAREVSGKEGEQDIDKVIDDYDNAKNQSKGIVRPKSYVIANIRSINRTIKKNLNAKQAKLFLKDNDDLFEADLSVKKSAYQDIGNNGVVRLKDESILLEIESRLRQLSKDIRAGRYNDEKFLAYRKSMERKIARLEKELLKQAKSKTPEPVTFNLVGEEIYVDTSKEMPRAIRRFLETELTKTAKSTTQLLTNDTDVHVQMNYKTFIENNAELLNSLTQTDVDEIIDFYMSSEILPNTNRAKLYTTVQQLLLGYILEVSGNKSMRFVLTKNQIDAVEHRLEFMVSTSATIVSTWRTVLKALKPEEVLHKAMLKVCDIELSPATEDELVKAIGSGDIKRIQLAKQKAYREALVRYKGRKRTVFDRLLRYERMAMLSGPGTWVRNITSNVGVTAGNRLSEILTSLLPQSKKSNRLKQYKITGTKVTSEYSTWIKEQVLDSGLLDLISDGLIKYNPRTSNKVTVEDELTRLIISNVESSLFDEASGVNKVSQFLQKTLKTMMSDKKFIDRSFIRYLGKMMTEDNTDISNGLTKDVMNTIAEAYTMAMQDYMHSSSFFAKLEQSLRTYLHRRFSPTTADGIYFVYKQVLPFANASWNWFMEGLNYTPIGLAKGIIQFAKLENTVNNMENARQKGERVRSARFAEYLAKRNIGKGIIGSVGLGIGILLVACGKVRFDDDDDKYKLYVNGSDGPIVVDISEIFGSNGILLGMAISQSFVDANGFNYDSFMKVIASSFNTMFMDSTFADMYNTFRYSDSFGDYLTGLPLDVAGMFVPNFVKTVGNTFKKYNVSYSAGFKGQLERFMVQSFAPFSYLMPYAINPYTGEPEVINEGWFGVNIINRYTPIKVKNYEFGDVERIAVSLGVKKSSLTGRYMINDEKVNLTNEELEAVNQFYGKLNKKELDDFTMNRTIYTVENENGEREELKYSKMTDKQKKAVIERIMSNNSQLAKVYILTSNGYKYYADDSEYENLRNAGVISNVYRKQGKMKGFVKIN